MNQSPSIEILQKLRQEIRRLEGFKSGAEARHIDLGLPGLAAHLPDGAVSLGAIHEFISESYEEMAATTAFTLALLSRAREMKGPVIWIARDNVQYVPGFAAYGIDPQRIIFTRPAKDQQALWVMEEALRYKGIAAVIGECASADLTATRRLQLAAEESGTLGLLLRSFCRQPVSSTCITRWQIKPASSTSALPGLGAPRWQIELLKARGGKPGSWTIEWRDQTFHQVEAPAEKAPAKDTQFGEVLRFRTGS